jgi:hypothetical protein
VLPQFPFGVLIVDYFTSSNAKLLLGLDPRVAWTALVLTVPLYCGLYFYLDQVVANEYGISKNCCFCLRK